MAFMFCQRHGEIKPKAFCSLPEIIRERIFPTFLNLVQSPKTLMKTIGNIRVSTDEQDLSKQKHLLLEYAQQHKCVIDELSK